MKFLIPLALFAVAGVSAAEKECEAKYIVDRCLSTEQLKIDDCGAADYDCQCAAYEAVATCYNNCPDDPRASSAQGQVEIFCKNASVFGSKALAQASKTAAVTGSQTTAAASAATTDADDEKAEDKDEAAPSGSATQSADSPDGTGAAANLARNTGGLLLAVAGVVAAML